MRVDALPGQGFTGTIDRVSPVVDAGSGTFRVTVAFAGDTGLRAGMFGRVDVVYDRRNDVLTVPRSALLQDQGEAAVFTVRDNKAVRVPVQLGYVNGEVAEVREGLREGEVVVTTGKVAVREGSDLQVLNPPDEAAIALGNGYAESVAQP
jgi:membrane fusion protein (multidrug efflux system)